MVEKSLLGDPSIVALLARTLPAYLGRFLSWTMKVLRVGVFVEFYGKVSTNIIVSFLKTVCVFSVGSLLATYGWYIVFSCILLYVAFQKLSTRLRALRQRQLDPAAATVG